MGPIVLKKLNIAFYEHYLLLHCAITILMSDSYIEKFSCKFVESLLNTFIIHSDQLYGSEFIVYNVHILSHLPSDVEMYGSLDSFSAFPFENYLGQLKRLVRSPYEPLQQVYLRLQENRNSISRKSPNDDLIFVTENAAGEIYLNDLHCKQYKRIIYKNFTFSIHSHSKSDAYFMTSEYVFEIHNIVVTPKGDALLVGKKFLS